MAKLDEPWLALQRAHALPNVLKKRVVEMGWRVRR